MKQSSGNLFVISKRRRREVSPEEFEHFLRRLDPERTQAWQEYGRLKDRLITFFQFQYNCQSDAESLAEEVLDRVAKKIEPIENVTEFILGIARNVRLETFRRSSRIVPFGDLVEQVDFSSCAESPEQSIVDSVDNERKRERFLKCMQSLDEKDQYLICQYYLTDHDNLEEHRQELAKMQGITIGALRMKIMRLKSQLEQCFERNSQVGQNQEQN